MLSLFSRTVPSMVYETSIGEVHFFIVSCSMFHLDRFISRNPIAWSLLGPAA